MKAIGVIPARLGSTRLAEKVLKVLDGRPMIQHVWERARQSKKLSDLMIACDDERILTCAKNFGGKAVLTRSDHPNGTSRVAEVASREEAEVFINIQGDEPMMHPSAIDQIVEAFEKDPGINVATCAVRRHDKEDYENPNVVKVVLGQNGDGLYFSRAPIPHFRGSSSPAWYLKHLGIYGYRKSFLLEFVRWEPGILEEAEKLEQLRILERGFSIRVIETLHDSWSVDTREDLETVEAKLKEVSNLRCSQNA